jgi:2',3'-cyclic-nucleotide 2'-phosphodiesterase (5'-nucleotidase family)
MVLPRRTLLAAPGLMLPGPARADSPITGADLVLACLSDLHSAGDRAAAALGALDAALAANRGVQALILVNGDVFERGNAVALRSGGAADWAFLGALRRRAPVVLNIGNHETALVDDLAEVVRRLRALDILVLSNLRDRRSGAAFAEASAEITLRGGRRMRLVGIATDEAMTYRQVVRETLDIPAAADWARTNLPGLLAGADLSVVLSHAGVAADRSILPLLPDGSLLLGGHEHLRFQHAEGATRYLHTGSWNRVLTLAGIAFGAGAPAVVLREVPVQPGVAEDPAQAATWRGVLAAHSAPEDREVLFHLPRPLPLPEAARLAATAVARATGTGTGLLGHTGFGTGLPAGAVTRLDWDAFLRFDGALFRAEADAATLAGLAPRVNQDEEVPLPARIGDFAYAAPPPGAAPQPIAANGWVRLNAARFLGTGALRFEQVPGLMLKSVVAESLRTWP